MEGQFVELRKEVANDKIFSVTALIEPEPKSLSILQVCLDRCSHRFIIESFTKPGEVLSGVMRISYRKGSLAPLTRAL